MSETTKNQSLPKPSLSPETLRDRLITHILMMRPNDVEYARFAAKQYHELLPWLDIYQGIKEAIQVQGLQESVHKE